MKKLSLILVVLIFGFISVIAQPCLPEGITFSTQEQVDNFQINYPNCTEIDGDVIIGGYSWSDITNLDSLCVINSIGGGLIMGYGYPGGHNPNLISLTGLSNLTSIGSNLTIAANHVLTNLTGLESLTSIGGELWIFNNDSLISLSGLDNIDVGTNDIYIYNNGLLNTCDVSWLCNYLTNPNGSINIYNNAPGCNNPPEIADDCGISMSCLPYGNYYFYSQDEIDSFQAGYPDCTELMGDVKISGNDISNLSGLNVVISIEGDLYFYNNNVLTSLDGLENLTSIGGALQFTLNNALINLIGLDGLTSIEGSFIVGFYQAISGGNPALTSLNGLDSLTSIGGSLRIIGNAALISFSGLDNVTSIGGAYSSIKINQNHALISLTGLANIDAASIGDLTIINNSILSNCEVESVCAYLASPNGFVEIRDNAFGCNSPQEVLDSCEANAVSISERYLLKNLLVNPNPFTTSTTLSYTLSEPSTVTVSIFNPQGQLIERVEQEQQKGEQQSHWNAEGLPAGMYFFRITAGAKVGGGKMIKY